jgi:DNA-binding NtrC family response regulator
VTLIEELGEHLTAEEMREMYERADKFLIHTQHAKTLLRLRHAARRTLAAERLLMTQQGTKMTHGAIEKRAPGQTPDEMVADAWAGCQLEAEVHRFEGQLIQQALIASQGQITRAARLLGVTHQCLANILQGRHRELLPSRTPIQRRRRSLVNPEDKAKGERQKGR